LFHNADTLCFHTEWAKKNLSHKYKYNNNNIKSVVSDAIDHDVFCPVSENKTQHKAKYSLNDNLFIIGSVMRNQKRKLIPDLLETFGRLCKSNTTEKIPVLYLHTSYPDGLSWDLPALLLEYQIADRVLLSYKCTNCNNFFPSVYVGPKTICKHCNTKKAVIASVQNGVSEQQLKEIYNLFDIYVQYAICEGFGIPPTEAAACGVPVISIDHEAMGEVGTNIGGDLIPVQRLFREQETNALRSYPDNNLLLDKLNKYILMNTNEIKSIGQKSRQMCMDNYSWDKTAKVFEEIFDNIDIEQKLSWTCPQRPINHKYVLSKMITIRDTVYEIVDNIISN
jgi:glycosyltransferase involved in cell wall biosynthesis